MGDHSKTGHFIEEYGEDGHFEGDFLCGFRHGRGKHVFRGRTYEGEWKWDKMEGHGTLTDPDNTIHKGEWKNSRQHGLGTIIDKDGRVIYEGEFKEGKRHGLGKQTFDNGDVYDGAWYEGMQHDRGVYHFANGDKFYGCWDKGVYHGVGVFHYSNGSISRRVYERGLLMSVQDYEIDTKKFSTALTREEMHKRTDDADFNKAALADFTMR